MRRSSQSLIQLTLMWWISDDWPSGYAHMVWFDRPCFSSLARENSTEEEWRNVEKLSVSGFRRSVLCCTSCSAVISHHSADSCPSPYHHPASNPSPDISPGFQSLSSRKTICLFHSANKLPPTPSYFPCSSLFPYRIFCILQSWFLLLWSAWKMS